MSCCLRAASPASSNCVALLVLSAAAEAEAEAERFDGFGVAGSFTGDSKDLLSGDGSVSLSGCDSTVGRSSGSGSSANLMLAGPDGAFGVRMFRVVSRSAVTRACLI